MHLKAGQGLVVLGPLFLSSREAARGPWHRDGVLRLFQPAVSFLLPCCSLPASPYSCSRYGSCIPPFLFHFSLRSFLWLWVLHPYHSSSVLPLLARSFPISYFHCELCATGLLYPASPSSPPASLLLFSTGSKLLFSLASLPLQVVISVFIPPSYPSLPSLGSATASLDPDQPLQFAFRSPCIPIYSLSCFLCPILPTSNLSLLIFLLTSGYGHISSQISGPLAFAGRILIQTHIFCDAIHPTLRRDC